MSQGAPHPRMHGLSHVTGGPDPIPGLLPRAGDDIADRILALGPDAFWKLDESDGNTAHDSSGNGYHLGADPAPVWGQPPGPPGDTTAHWGTSSTSVARTMPFFTDDFTVGVWVNLLGFPGFNPGELIGQGTAFHSQPGWGIVVVGTAGTGTEPWLAGVVDGDLLRANTALDLDTWVFVALVRDAGTWKLYLDGLLQAETLTTDPGSAAETWTWLGNDLFSSHTTYLRDGNLSYAFILDRPLGSADLLGLMDDVSGGGEGWVLEIDEDGNPVWVPPGEVTVNGDDLPNSSTPRPPWEALPGDPTEIDPELQWMMDQPFTWNGPEFQVPPKKWTTIPFTQPLMERQSNVTGGSTTWFELEWYDERAAGWINPDTPRVITIPHDVPWFNTVYTWYQICLKLEAPAVEPETSWRWLRIFETTHQKPLLVSGITRDTAGFGGGAINLYRDPTAHGLAHDGPIFASGDTDTSGSHGNIMFVPNSVYGHYEPAQDWLPRVDGVATLKKGMRLLAQVWHDASTTLTMDCSGVWPYRPHFVVHTPGLRAWGPPWSDWPEYEG